MKTGYKDRHILRQIFSYNYILALCTELSNSSIAFADGLIVSIFLGSEAMAASGMLCPFFTAIAIIHGLVLTGTQKLCIRAHCSGDRKSAEEIYSTSLATALILIVVSMLCCAVFSDAIIDFLGAGADAPGLHNAAKDYLVGLIFSIPGLVLVPLLTPIAQLVGKGEQIRLSVLVMTAADIALNILAAVSGLGMFGIGLSTSISQTAGLIIIIYALAKNEQLGPHIGSVRPYRLKAIIRESSPKLVKRLCKVVKPITVNRMLLIMAGATGMTAMSVRNNISGLFECTGAALGAAVFILAVIDTGEHNFKALKWLERRSVAFTLCPIAIISILITVFARPVAGIYIHDSEEILRLTVSAVRYMAADLVLMALIEVLNNYWHGTGRIMTTNTFLVLQRLVYPLLTISVLGHYFGLEGVWMSFPAASLLSVLTVPLFALRQKGRLDFFPLPGMGNDAEYESCQYEITELKDIEAAAEEIQEYCSANGIDMRRSMFTALCFEEVCIGVLENGVAKPRRKKAVAASITVSDNTVHMILRDNCKFFDYRSVTFDPSRPERHVGIRMVMGLAKNIRCINMYGMNCISLEL